MITENEDKFDRTTYLTHVKNQIAKYEYVVIYGAGRKALGLYDFLMQNDIKADAFYVTDKGENKDCERNLKIYGVKEKKFAVDKTLVLIGVRKRWNQQVIEALKQNGYSHYIEAPDKIEYFAKGDMDRSHRTVLQITAQIGCKIDCRYCPQRLFIQKYTQDATREYSMTLELFKQYVGQTEKDVIIDFAGFSEPFFNPECIQMIRYAHEKGHEIELFTTLVGLDKDGFEQIKDIPFREVVLHIPDKNRNSKIDVTKDYMELLDMVLCTSKPDGRPFADWASCHGEIADEVKDIVAGKIRVISQLHDRAGNLGDDKLEQKHGLRGKITCSNTVAEYHNHNVLLPDGTILLCDSDWGMEHVLGNLEIEKNSDILKGEVIKEVYHNRQSENGCVICRNCCYAVEVQNVEVR